MIRMTTFQKRLIFFGIFVFAFILRIYGINWDLGLHFHPDERMLVMVTDRIEFFSNLNPEFFNYGSLPVYILAAVAQLIDGIFKTSFDNYDGLLILGRLISVFLDLLVLALISKIAKILLKSDRAVLISIFFYAVAFFPIQNSHFFIVDNFLNFFTTSLLYLLLKYRESIKKQSSNNLLYIFLIGINYAACLTTKVTSIIFLPMILLMLSFPHFRKETVFQKIRHKINLIFHKKRRQILKFTLITTLKILFFIVIVLGFSFLFMPYAFFQYDVFLKDVGLQISMNNNPYVFPYTLQYVGTLPYFYYLKNILLWGLGPFISIFSIIGFIFITKKALQKNTSLEIIFFTIFYLIYFVIIGKSAVKFMRYMLLMYPFFAILAGYGASVISHKLCKNYKDNVLLLISLFIFMILPLLYSAFFINIYSSKNTRIQATEWIYQNIADGSTLAVEHWDDRVPIFDPGKYNYEEMTLYDIPDDQIKWQVLNEKIKKTDYIIIASNRLYTPLMRLQKCGEHGRCYPITKSYYEALFSEELGFRKVAEFTSYPRIKFGSFGFEINDDMADESFTVYDHPKIMIFKRM